jgi:oligoendopeptidase F
MTAYFGALGAFSRTFGTIVGASAQRSWFFARSRHYASSLDAALNGPNIPVSVYERLVEGVNRNLPSLHRYLALRKRMLVVETLH